eukprot:TRINITY_DN17464_c0_g1_i1.p1 TRINITY_DN17464_c0_g1~~TRINITY_DN17464_c0_g1_i1.p1  ORF type:complete len:235 (+),score=27.94 TRINITY_DN17464_c0_g1_i1:226-930(+)
MASRSTPKALATELKRVSRTKEDCCRCHKLQENSTTAFKRCGRCKNAVYCSVECQKAHWKEPAPKGHKERCDKVVEGRQKIKNSDRPDRGVMVAKFAKWRRDAKSFLHLFAIIELVHRRTPDLVTKPPDTIIYLTLDYLPESGQFKVQEDESYVCPISVCGAEMQSQMEDAWEIMTTKGAHDTNFAVLVCDGVVAVVPLALSEAEHSDACIEDIRKQNNYSVEDVLGYLNALKV